MDMDADQHLYFITAHGVCGLTVEWNAGELEIEADDWLYQWGDRIGSGTAKIPTGGWVDLSQFAAVTTTR